MSAQTYRQEREKRVVYLFDGDLSALGPVETHKIELTPQMEKLLHWYSVPVEEIEYTRFQDYRIVGSDKLTEQRTLSKLIHAKCHVDEARQLHSRARFERLKDYLNDSRWAVRFFAVKALEEHTFWKHRDLDPFIENTL